MPAVTIRNLSVKTHQGLKKRAKRNGHSTEAEMRLILDEAASPETVRRPKAQVGLGTQLQAIARKYGVTFPEIPRDKTPARYATFK